MFLQDKSAEAYNKPAYALAEREPPLDIRITKVAAGYAHSVFLSNTGHVYVCGSGESGQLGLMKPDGTKETIVYSHIGKNYVKSKDVTIIDLISRLPCF